MPNRQYRDDPVPAESGIDGMRTAATTLGALSDIEREIRDLERDEKLRVGVRRAAVAQSYRDREAFKAELKEIDRAVHEAKIDEALAESRAKTEAARQELAAAAAVTTERYRQLAWDRYASGLGPMPAA